MRRYLRFSGLAAAAAVIAAAGGAAAQVAPASVAAPPRVQLTGLACRSPSDPAQRSVSIETVMRPVAGTRSLSLRLTLLKRHPGGGAAHAVAPTGDLGVWLTPAEKTLGRRPGDVWKLAKTVYDVGAPARYQFAVAFRWEGAGGKVLRRTTLRSPACTVTDPRPDLLVRSVAVTPLAAHHGRARYVALILNRGHGASGPFAVQFTPTTGAEPRTQAVGSLAPGARIRVGFTGPACDATAPPVVVADPSGRVDDADRANNTRTVVCPGA